VLPVPHVPDGLTISPIRGSAGCQGTEAIMPDIGKVEVEYAPEGARVLIEAAVPSR
jgi:hypothetical protein